MKQWKRLLAVRRTFLVNHSEIFLAKKVISTLLANKPFRFDLIVATYGHKIESILRTRAVEMHALFDTNLTTSSLLVCHLCYEWNLLWRRIAGYFVSTYRSWKWSKYAGAISTHTAGKLPHFSFQHNRWSSIDRFTIIAANSPTNDYNRGTLIDHNRMNSDWS